MSVVTVDQYRFQTRDVSTGDFEIASALAEAQSMVEDCLHRPLELATRTEVVLVGTNGYVYPLATPIATVTTPTDTTIVDSQFVVAVDADYPNPTGFSAWLTPGAGGRSSRAQIVYEGGWTSVTLPATLRRAIIALARAIQAGESQFIAGASSLSLGDASVSFGANAPVLDIDLLVPGLGKRISGYRAR